MPTEETSSSVTQVEKKIQLTYWYENITREIKIMMVWEPNCTHAISYSYHIQHKCKTSRVKYESSVQFCYEKNHYF